MNCPECGKQMIQWRMDRLVNNKSAYHCIECNIDIFTGDN